jgi:hypothetical protein
MRARLESERKRLNDGASAAAHVREMSESFWTDRAAGPE